MSPTDPILAAIARHREAWDKFQVAPKGSRTVAANLRMLDALDALLATSCTTRPGARALLEHLLWWLDQEAEFARDYSPEYSIAQARAADLALSFGLADDPPDPIFAVLDAANTAEGAHVLACEGLDESDDASIRSCNAVCERAAAARREVMRTLPTTIGGLQALAAHHARWSEAWAEDGFLHIVRSLEGCESKQLLRPLGRAKTEQDQSYASANRSAGLTLDRRDVA